MRDYLGLVLLGDSWWGGKSSLLLSLGSSGGLLGLGLLGGGGRLVGLGLLGGGGGLVGLGCGGLLSGTGVSDEGQEGDAAHEGHQDLGDAHTVRLL